MRPKHLPAVSAIVPVYNAEKTLLRAIESLLVQPEINEIILVEDGSKDGSLDLCQKLASTYPAIQVFTHPHNKNKGAPASRNLGLTKITNKWVQFMDADDELLPGKIKSQLEILQDHTALVVSGFLKREKGEEFEIPVLKDIWSGLLATRLGTTSSNMWNAELIKQAGGWDESLPNVQEYHLMFEMLKLNESVVFSQDYLTVIHSQPNSITNSSDNLEVKRDTYFRFRDALRKYFVAQGKFTFRRMHYYNVCTGQMLKYHSPAFKVPFNKFYFLLYKGIKSI